MIRFLTGAGRIITGLVFVFSGFVKAVDPLGSGYKFSDYFHAFGLNFLDFLSVPVAIILPAVELVIGIGLLLAFRMRVVSFVLLVFMIFFTLLTLILALTNPVTDCGCFGDAIILTNWQTFGKNVILLLFTGLIYRAKNTYDEIRTTRFEWAALTLFFAGSIGLSIYCINHLPILNFRPYKTGTHIPSATAIPSDAQPDVYETHLFYKNIEDGKIMEFTMENFPDDTLWEFVDSRSVLISRGYEPPIHDFSVSWPNGENLTETIKNFKGYTFLLIAYDLGKANFNGLKEAEMFYNLSRIYKDVEFHALTASLDEEIMAIRDSLGIGYDFGHADEIMLKTVIRSNPGLLLLKNGTIMGQWHHNDFPTASAGNMIIDTMLRLYPFAPGIDLRYMQTPPEGSRPDIYHTRVLYRNLVNDSTAYFDLDKIPSDESWVFISSESNKIATGYRSPLEDFAFFSQDGINLADRIMNDSGSLFLISVNEPHTLDPEILDRLNRLSIMANSFPSGPALFYAMTGLNRDQLIGFADSFISPINFGSASPDLINRISGEGVSLLYIKDGVILGRWDNKDIPDTGQFQSSLLDLTVKPEFETAFLPYLISDYTRSAEKSTMALYIVFVLFMILIINVLPKKLF